MTGRAYIAATGLISPLGRGTALNGRALQDKLGGLRPLACFATPDGPSLPAGEILGTLDPSAPSRTHALARLAAGQILETHSRPPDAVVLGTTTGGLSRTEILLAQGVTDPADYRFHGVNTVAEDLARLSGCSGPVLTISTACSSGAVAIGLALEMIRRGQARRVLAGGVDCLCRLTYYGFRSLLLIDPLGARPLDRERKGMSVAEGAGLLLLTADPPAEPGCVLLGAGLSCDASHPTQPHPDGLGARKAMERALADAGLGPGEIDYINLHGTGTPDNDLAEAKAVHQLFGPSSPPASSVKGAWGHPLAAAGAMEAALATDCITAQRIPPTAGLLHPDPRLNLNSPSASRTVPVERILSNSFGFGGNNAALVVGITPGGAHVPAARDTALEILEWGCITGAGPTEATLAALRRGRSCSGQLPLKQVTAPLNPRSIRRLKRLPCLALALAAHICRNGAQPAPQAVCLGTGWGAMSETHSFLTRLFASDYAFPSPTDFIGSVHNAPAGQIAMHHGATGANITTSGGDYSFEQALMAADLTAAREPGPCLLLGADEAHPALTPLFDPSVSAQASLADGGGGLLVQAARVPRGEIIRPRFYRQADRPRETLEHLVQVLTEQAPLARQYGAVLAGIPAAEQDRGEAQTRIFRSLTRYGGPLISYRRFTGEFATAAAVAAVLAADLTRRGYVPAALAGGNRVALDGRGILILGLGAYVTAMEVVRR